MDRDIYAAAAAGIKWLENQEPVEVKDLSRSIQALSLWNENTSLLIELLLSKKKDAFWKTDKPIPDTARAISALAECKMVQPGSIEWILEQQKDGNWSISEIDTSYALIALADSGIRNEPGCEWLFHKYGNKWEHAGTTSLILIALIKQNRHRYKDFIKDRASWLLSKRKDGGWIYIATSNLVLQALILSGEAGRIDIDPSIKWLLGKKDNGNWGDITSTALSLISLRFYLNKIGT